MMDMFELDLLIRTYRLVIRPTVAGGYSAAVFKSVSLDGKTIEIWKKTYAEDHNLERAVRACVLKRDALGEMAVSWPSPNE